MIAKAIFLLGFLVLSTILSTNAFAQKSVFDQTVVEKENWEPAIPRPEQEKTAVSAQKNSSTHLGTKKAHAILGKISPGK